MYLNNGIRLTRHCPASWHQPVTVQQEAVKAYMDKLLNNEKLQQQTLRKKGSTFTEKENKLRVSGFD
jgi:hypothetical protein